MSSVDAAATMVIRHRDRLPMGKLRLWPERRLLAEGRPQPKGEIQASYDISLTGILI
jgi:hypothetical protein